MFTSCWLYLPSNEILDRRRNWWLCLRDLFQLNKIKEAKGDRVPVLTEMIKGNWAYSSSLKIQASWSGGNTSTKAPNSSLRTTAVVLCTCLIAEAEQEGIPNLTFTRWTGGWMSNFHFDRYHLHVLQRVYSLTKYWRRIHLHKRGLLVHHKGPCRSFPKPCWTGPILHHHSSTGGIHMKVKNAVPQHRLSEQPCWSLDHHRRLYKHQL